MIPLTILWLAWFAADAPDKDFVGPPAPIVTSVEADDPQSIRMRIDHNMRASEEKLRKRSVDSEAKRLQDSILRDIDRLIELVKQSPPQSSEPQPPQSGPPSNPPPDGNPPPDEKPSASQQDGPGGGGQRTNQQGSGPPRPGGGSAGRERQPGEKSPTVRSPDGESRRDRRARSGKSSYQAKGNSMPSPSGAGKMDPNAQMPGPNPGDSKGYPGNNATVATGATMNPTTNGPPDRLANMSRDVWGHLPEAMRQEVDHYYRDKFMPRYREMLQQYYTRLAEAERREKKQP